MRLPVIISLTLLSVFAFFSGSAVMERKKPRASFMGVKKGNVDKLTFMGAKELELENNADSAWYISKYEFDFSCDGNMTLLSNAGSKITKEIITMVKDCRNNSIADFRFIIAKNRKTGKEIRLNDIQLKVQN
jgi:hypothetical protein